MKLTNIVSSKGEKLRRELLKAEFSKEDKQKASKIINNSGGIQIEYYKLNNVDEKDLITNLIMILPTIINAVSGESYTRMSQQYIGSNGGILSTNDRHVILGFAFINVTSIIKYLDGPAFTLEGTLQERADYLTTIINEDKINIYDYIEPITEEEFYNLKYE